MRRTTLTLSALALISTLGACGSSPEQNAQGDDTDQQQSASDAIFQEVSTLFSQSSTKMDDKQTVTMEISVEGGLLQGSPAAGLQDQTCQVDISNIKIACEGASTSIITKDAVYIKMADQGQSGKPWLKQSLKSSGPSKGTSQIRQVRQFSDIESMLPPGSEVAGRKETQLNGEKATRYDIVTDTKKAAAESEGFAKSSFQAFVDQGINELNRTVWVGTDELPLKVKNVTPPMKVAGLKVPETIHNITYSGWGEPVDITIPPAGKVSEF